MEEQLMKMMELAQMLTYLIRDKTTSRNKNHWIDFNIDTFMNIEGFRCNSRVINKNLM